MKLYWLVIAVILINIINNKEKWDVKKSEFTG
jgi:hypothetical protein